MPTVPAEPKPSTRRTRRGGVLLGLLLGAVVLEAGARLALATNWVRDRTFSAVDATSWRLRWLARHAETVSYEFSFDRHHPLRGWTLAPGLRDVVVFGDKRLSSSSRGLRGRREHAIPKPPGTLRVAVFGDSFTFGEEVSDEETFAHRLEELLPGVEVLNFGVHGYGHDQALLYLREALPLYQPDVVLVGHVNDDALRNMLTFRSFAKPRFRLAGETLHLEGVPVPTPEAVLAAAPWRSRFFDLVTMVRERLLWRWGDRIGESDRLTAAILAAIFRESRAGGARPGVVLLPVWGELAVDDPAPLPGEQFVVNVAQREQVPCLRLRPLFVERARLGAELETVGHWGPMEHQVAAGGIADFLRRERLLP